MGILICQGVWKRHSDSETLCSIQPARSFSVIIIITGLLGPRQDCWEGKLGAYLEVLLHAFGCYVVFRDTHKYKMCTSYMTVDFYLISISPVIMFFLIFMTRGADRLLSRIIYCNKRVSSSQSATHPASAQPPSKVITSFKGCSNDCQNQEVEKR